MKTKKVKKLMLLILFVVIGPFAFSGEGGQDYILTEKACFYFKKVRWGFNHSIIGIKSNGEKLKFSRDEVIRFRKGGYIYEKMAIVKNDKKSNTYDFMKVICRRDEMTLYEYTNCNDCSKKHMHYYVFRLDKFVVELCSHGEVNLLARFTSVN